MSLFIQEMLKRPTALDRTRTARNFENFEFSSRAPNERIFLFKQEHPTVNRLRNSDLDAKKIYSFL